MWNYKKILNPEEVLIMFQYLKPKKNFEKFEYFTFFTALLPDD